MDDIFVSLLDIADDIDIQTSVNGREYCIEFIDLGSQTSLHDIIGLNNYIQDC